MRTKVLLGAAIMAASLASSMAQNVYSINVVGYVNYTLVSGKYTLVANPLDATMGNPVAIGAPGDYNNVTNLFTATTTPGLANGTYVQVYNSAVGKYGANCTYNAVTKKWLYSTNQLNVGNAVMFYNGATTNVVVTFTGQVQQGAYTVSPAGGFLGNHAALVGSPAPIGGDTTNSTTAIFAAGNTLGLLPNTGDYVQTYSSATSKWSGNSSYNTVTKKWSPATTISPAQGFLYYNSGASAKTWASNFTVQ
jgi:hypothetical protein